MSSISRPDAPQNLAAGSPRFGTGIGDVEGQASYCDGVISVLLGRETSSTLCAVSAPAMGRPSGSIRPS